MYRELSPGDLLAQVGGLQQGEALLQAASHVERSAVEEVQIPYLRVHQLVEIRDVQEVSHLLAGPAVAEVAQLPAEVVPGHPEGEDALVHLAHLPGTGYYPAAVYEGFYAIGRSIFFDEHLRGQLGRPVEGTSTSEREVLGDTVRRDPRVRLLIYEHEPRLVLLV